MTPCTRGPAPQELVDSQRELTDRFVANPSIDFRFPARVREAVVAALEAMTDGHCAYCDSFPLGSTDVPAIDHFRPKAHFPRDVAAWGNLYRCCGACNHAKADRAEDQLLRPDEAGYSFERYFEYVFHTGELAPNPAASASDQARAQVTIDVLDLRRAPLCSARFHAVRNARALDEPPTFRFLQPFLDPAQ